VDEWLVCYGEMSRYRSVEMVLWVTSSPLGMYVYVRELDGPYKYVLMKRRGVLALMGWLARVLTRRRVLGLSTLPHLISV
jgi:hypothetical protein